MCVGFFCVVLLFMSTEMDQKLFNVLVVLYDMCVLCKLLTSLTLVVILSLIQSFINYR